MARPVEKADNIVRLPSALESSHTFCLWRLQGEHLMAMGREKKNNSNDLMFSEVQSLGTGDQNSWPEEKTTVIHFPNFFI